MLWSRSLLLMLLTSACFVATVSLWGVPDAEKVEHDHFKHSTRDKSSILQSLRPNEREPSKVLVFQPSLTKPEHSESTRSKISNEESMKIQFTEGDDRLLAKINTGQTLATVKPKTRENGRFNEILTSPDPEYPGEARDDISGDQTAAQSEESGHWFGKEMELENTSTKVSELPLDLYTHHKDEFHCPPCNCSFVNHSFVIANCTSKGLTSFPLKLPNKTLALILSSNRLRALATSSFLHYPYLENITVRSNKILTEIKNSSIGVQRSNVKVLNITYCSIRTIQYGSFEVTPELTHLIFRYNHLTHLTKSTFKGLGKLLHLDLSQNTITSLEVGIFDDLIQLLSLDLSGNKQLGYMEKHFPPLLFQNLKQLQKLSIFFNTLNRGNKEQYPSRTLQDLVELRELSIDGLPNPAEFGPEMKALEKLTSLEIHGYCFIVNITETFFQNTPHLTSFNMDSCKRFLRVHPNAYTKLERLQTLSISRMNEYRLETAFQDLAGLNNSRLNSITFKRLRRPVIDCQVLDYDKSQHLHNFPLVYLDLSDNSISKLGNDFLRDLPKTITTLILTRNKLTSETRTMNHLSVLTGLEVLDLSIQNANHKYQKGYSSLGEDVGNSDLNDQISNPNRGINFSSESDQVNELSQYESDVLEEQIDSILIDRGQPREMSQSRQNISIPTNLRTLKAYQYNFFGMEILANNLPKRNSLSVIDFSNSFMSTWGTGRLPPGITFANLGYNYCMHIRHNFFQANNFHRHLLLNKNFLGSDFANDSTGEIFSKLSKTEYLDISANLIYTIPKLFFSGLSSLRYLHMSDNKLSILNASFAHMKSLQFIDFSRNSISWIDAGTRDDLDVIAASPGHVLKVDLTMNSLPCTCDGLELISWMATTKVHFHKKHQLTCYPDNKVSEPLGDLENRRQRLQRSCMSKSVFIIGCSAALTVVMVIVMLGFMYRYRWKLRYLHNTAMAAIFGFKPEVCPKSGCTFDAYFVYTTDTRDFVLDQCLKELELTRGHRLCVEDRDFLAGTYIVSSIVSAVRNSTKTVVVLTPDLLKEPYCEYSFKMAVMEELYKQRTVLHLLLYQPIPSDQMSHDELSLMRRNSYIEYPPDGGADEGVSGEFWDELSRVIGHSGRDNVEPILDMD